MDDKKMFPIQRSTPVPWSEAEKAWRTYAKLYGGSQSLELLGQRGGFGVNEFACFWHGHDVSSDCTHGFPDFPLIAAEKRIAELEAELARAREKYRIVREALVEGRTQAERNSALVLATVEPSSLLADNVALREAFTRVLNAIGVGDNAWELGRYGIHIDEAVEILAALNQPATTAALERVRREAKAEVWEEIAEERYLPSRVNCLAKAAALRGGE